MVNKLIKQTRIAYYSEKITACTHYQKCICRVAKHLLGERGSPSLPQTASPSEVTETFSSFFMEKIQNIRRGLQTGQVHGVDQDVDASSVTTPLERFTRASDDEMKTLILNSPDKSCDLNPMPQTASPSEVTETFSSFFMEKIQNIRRGLQTGQVHGVDQDVDASSVTTPLERFTRASDDEMKTLILNSPDKSCDLNPMPTWLLKLCVDELLPIITAIGNASMDSSSVPRVFKCAQVRPQIKKPTLDPDILKHYIPMSNLPFIAKVLEEVVDTQI